MAAEHRFDGALDLQQAARHAGAEQTPALKSAAQRIGRERKPVDPRDAQAGKQPMKSLTVPRRQKRRNRLIGVVRIAARGRAAVDQNVGRGAHRLLVQEAIEQRAAPGDGRFHHQHAAAGTQHPLDLAKEGDRKLDVMQHVHHDNVGGARCGERQTLRIGDAIEPRRELNVGRHNVAETLFQVADAAADLDGQARPAVRDEPIIKIVVDEAQHRLALPHLRVLAERLGRVCHHGSAAAPPSAPARTHHCGCRALKVCAARIASAAVENNAKQVAPEPDMRARRQPESARNAVSVSAMAGATAIAGSSRSLAW